MEHKSNISKIFLYYNISYILIYIFTFKKQRYLCIFYHEFFLKTKKISDQKDREK